MHSRLSSLLFGLIIFFSATQLGLHFWPLSSLVYGIRIDYLSPILYFLDILIILFLSLRRLFDRRPEQSSSRDAEGGRSLLIGIVPVLLLNLLYSQNPLATLSWSLHLLLYLVFFSTMPPIKSKFENLRIWDLRLILTFSLLFQLALAAGQVYLSHSIGGLTYYLGERTIAVGQPAVALGTFMDSVVLRAYGTFGHPNVLAGWLVVSLLIILKLTLTKKLIIGNWLLVISTLTTIVGVLLTQSRSAGLALFGLVIPLCLINKLKIRIIYFSILFCSLFYVLPTITPPRADLSSTERHALQGVSLKVIQNFSLFGAGAQASISTYPAVAPENRLLQPDHNSLTLFLSWFGIFGLLAILYSLRSLFENLRIYDLRFVVPLLPLLLLDHYFLTSPQGLFIFILYFQTIRLSDTPAS